MSILKKIGDFFAGAGGNVIDTIADTVDRFITNPDEKKEFLLEIKRIEAEQLQSQRKFITEMEELTQKRESEIEETIRKELDAQKSVIIAELEQGDKYTKRARPTVVYVGLVFILLEIFGLRQVILSNLKLDDIQAVIDSSNEIFKTFLMAWAGVVGVYAVGRSMEKRGMRTSWTSAITGEKRGDVSEVREKAIIAGIKDKLKDIKW